MKHIEQRRPVLGAALIEALQADCGYAAASIITDGLTNAIQHAKSARSIAETIAIELMPFIRPDLFKREV